MKLKGEEKRIDELKELKRKEKEKQWLKRTRKTTKIRQHSEKSS